MINFHVVNAVLRKNLSKSFSNPTAYVFITIFIVACAIFQFSWGDQFFRENLAELGPLNKSFAYLLLFFIPVLTMSSWSEERKLGTEEFLLTLPATDMEVILGKYKALLLTYFISLIFSFSLVFVLSTLGSPDYGLIFSSYLSYLLLGATMLSIGVVASMLTANATIAFILGVLFNAIFLFSSQISQIAFSIGWESLGRTLENLGFGEKSGLIHQFTEMTSGVISFSGVFYLISVTAVMLYLAVILVSRRHWMNGSQGTSLSLHYSMRILALIFALSSLNVILNRVGIRADLTSSRLHSFSPISEKLLKDLKKPVLIEAFISEEVPTDHIEIRKNTLATLREIEARSGGQVRLLIHETAPNSEAALQAQEKYGIQARELREENTGTSSIKNAYLGVAVTCGANQQVISFMDRGLNPEYELIRTIRVVSQTARKKVGILTTQANINGGIDFQMRRNTPAWQVVTELKKQYEIVEVGSAEEYPKDLDVLLAVMPSSMEQEDLDRLEKYILSGKKTFLLNDALPLYMLPLSDSQRHLPPDNPQMGAGTVKGDYNKLMSKLGIDYPADEIIWSANNPYPSLAAQLPYEIPFSQAAGKEFNTEHEVSQKLQILVTLFPGHLKAAKNSWTKFTPLFQIIAGNKGTIKWGDVVETGFMGQQMKSDKELPKFRKMSNETFTLGAHISGSRKVGEGDKAQEEKVDVIVVNDVDFISDQFFGMRRGGDENFNFDNVTFFLNGIDYLSNDKDFIELRSKRKQHRTLTKFDEIRKDLNNKKSKIVEETEKSAEKELEKAQKVMDETLAKVQKQDDLKVEEKFRILATVQEAQQRSLQIKKEDIDRKKAQKVQDAERELAKQMDGHKQKVVLMAIALPPILPFILALIVYFRRRSREMENVSKNRIKEIQ